MSAPKAPSGRRCPAYVYAEGFDQEIDIGQEGIPKLTGDMVLWVELDGDHGDVGTAAELLSIPDDAVRRLGSDDLRPSVADYEDCLHVRIVGVTSEVVP